MLDIKDAIGGMRIVKKEIKKRRHQFKPQDKRSKHTTPRILDYIDEDTIKKLYLNAINPDIPDTNDKADEILKILGPEFHELGTGTNRIAVMKDGYVFKIALDHFGMVDNLSEYKRSAEEPEYLAKTYETNRVIAIAEYVNLIQESEFTENRDKLKIILAYLTSKYVIEDLGLTVKNYCNWGYRDDGSLVALDYAYMYPIKGNPDALRCECGGHITIDHTFTTYRCNNSKCGMVYTTGEIRNKMNVDALLIDDAEVLEEAGATEEVVNNGPVKRLTDEELDDRIPIGFGEPINTMSMADAAELEEYKDIIKEILSQDSSPLDLDDTDDSASE